MFSTQVTDGRNSVEAYPVVEFSDAVISADKQTVTADDTYGIFDVYQSLNAIKDDFSYFESVYDVTYSF